MSETAIVRTILLALEARRYWAWRVNSGAVMAGSGKSQYVYRGAPAGTPDILVVLTGGRLVGLEVKTATGKQKPSQRAWQAKAEAHGVPYAVVRSAREALEFLKELTL